MTIRRLRPGRWFRAMNGMPSNLGAEPKKVAILIAVAVIGGFAYLYNRNPSEGPSSAPPIASRAERMCPSSIAIATPADTSANS